MKVLARPMGTGKTEELLRIAAEDKALVLTDNKAELQEKANRYGITVQVVDLNDLQQNNYGAYNRVYIHKMDDFINSVLLNKYSLNLKGYSIRLDS